MLAAGHDELIMGDDEDAHRRLPRDGARAGGYGSSCLRDTTQLAGSGIPGKWDSWTARAKMLCNSNFYGYICVLLVKTISMIYIYYIK